MILIEDGLGEGLGELDNIYTSKVGRSKSVFDVPG